MALLDLTARGVLVAGGGRGIGEATACVLARAGAAVAVVDRNADRAERVAKRIESEGGRAIALVDDVTHEGAGERVVAAAERGLGSLDLVANIIGSASWDAIVSMDDAVWERDLLNNLKHHVALSRAAARLWTGRGRPGAYCAVASISGLFSSARHTAYGASKAALVSFVKSAAEEWWPQRIRVNAVAPGAVRTPRIEETLMQGTAAPPSDFLERMALPEDIAGAIAFLLSDLARRITGQVLVVDGGFTTRFPYGAR